MHGSMILKFMIIIEIFLLIIKSIDDNDKEKKE